MAEKEVETKVGENLLETGSGEIVIYNPDESVRLDVRLVGDTVWLTLKQLAILFDRDRTVIGRHIKNIFSEGELDSALVCAKFAQTGEYGRASRSPISSSWIFPSITSSIRPSKFIFSRSRMIGFSSSTIPFTWLAPP